MIQKIFKTTKEIFFFFPKEKVFEKYHVNLELELKIIGEKIKNG